jgi:hypothetical protein
MENDIEYYLRSADPEAIRFTGLDDSIIGTDQNGNLVYDYNLMHKEFMSMGMSLVEADEWIDYNVLPINGGSGFTVLFR